jgi:uncharacterized membrane protein
VKGKRQITGSGGDWKVESGEWIETVWRQTKEARMKRMMALFIGMAVVMAGSAVLAQTDGGGMMGYQGRGYGMVGGYMAWWAVYGLVKAAVVVVGLWLLLRIARAVEKIAATK